MRGDVVVETAHETCSGRLQRVLRRVVVMCCMVAGADSVSVVGLSATPLVCGWP